MTKGKNILKLIVAVLIAELAGIIGSFFTTPSISSWYASLARPALNPPSWVFAPVWTTLFALMGIAAFLVWKKGFEQKGVKIALRIFVYQLILNTSWSIIFFGEHKPGLAFLDLVLLWLAIIATIFYFSKVSKAAAWLLAPYILWVTFAGYLNFSIWQLNKNENQNIFSGIVCTQEAKMCPDGSYVGRTGPNCEFAVCPGNYNTELWKTFSDGKLSFKYPGSLFTKYIDVREWPPKVAVQEGVFSCEETPKYRSDLLTRVSKEEIGGREYCLTISEGVFSDYEYLAEKNGELISVEFSLKYSDCSLFEEPEKTECQEERITFNMDDIVGGMMESVEFE